jgi:hypothetical protein
MVDVVPSKSRVARETVDAWTEMRYSELRKESSSRTKARFLNLRVTG